MKQKKPFGQGKIKYLIGIDEVGRGPIAGPVAVCAFCIPIQRQHSVLTLFPKGEVRDSKKLNERVREEIYKKVLTLRKSEEIVFEVCFSSSKIIDTKGLSFAIRNALMKSLSKLCKKIDECRVLLDGSLKAPAEYKSQQTIIKGDEKEAVIALASIMAKVTRDRRMKILAKKFPYYGFEVHKGYGTKAHYLNLMKHGLSSEHRRSFLSKILK